MASDATKGGFHGDAKTVTIRIFGSHDAAELAASNLEAHGIRCWIKADDCGGMYPNLAAVGGGVRLLVRALDADAATALLDTEASPAEINQIEAEAIGSALPETAPLKKLAMGQILAEPGRWGNPWSNALFALPKGKQSRNKNLLSLHW